MKNRFTLLQFLRFFVVGVMNTAVDFMVLNVLLLVFSSSKGSGWYLCFKAISFLVAVVNSYYFNKYWVFKHTAQPEKSVREKTMFLVVSLVGFVINVGVSTALFTTMTHLYGDHEKVFGNVSALVGTVVVLLVNFILYKFVVFKKTS